MKANIFVSKLCNIATTEKTVYAWGMFGCPINSVIVSGRLCNIPHGTRSIKSTMCLIRYAELTWKTECWAYRLTQLLRNAYMLTPTLALFYMRFSMDKRALRYIHQKSNRIEIGRICGKILELFSKIA